MSITYKKSSQSISVKWSASHLPNNLAILRSSKSRRSAMFGVSYKTSFAMATVSEDGTKQIQGQVMCRTPGSNNKPVMENDSRFTAYVIQAAFVNLPVRSLLVLACTKSIQIFEPDGTTNLHIHMTDKTPPNRTEASIYARGITGVDQNLLCIGNHQGEILVFNIPPKGTNIFLKETLAGHQYGITDLVSNNEYLVSSDTSGMILIWNIGTMSQINQIEPLDNSGITSLAMWNNCLIAGYAHGMLRIFDIENVQMIGSITAHARCINAIDCNEEGLIASVSDDCYVRIWKLSGDAEDLQISHECNHHIENNPLVGVKFMNLNHADIAVSVYDSNEIIVLRA
ncbi:unnamed protein product [Adineta steineri]|uniref:WD repeat-containing protein 54 beta-propeller domain-containing protein n=1 Tax=Adineta steineri TaxID=433720 RepID=A0A816FVS1_9BILA|nr:unnamed protein product [Adineta steineri]CAF1170330.1 unnamed protein product [Adineta steineri]CAF1565930.1 unnamed protein product [Adineta steineri]CAF1666773.1 unnamed protein product [Adineta steineri]